jgi:hypothetical protein
MRKEGVPSFCLLLGTQLPTDAPFDENENMTPLPVKIKPKNSCFSF